MNSRYLEIVRLLIDAAPFVFSQGGFALKGGTAINLFVQGMPRLSVDIDLVYTNLNHPDRDSALEAIEKSLQAVAELLESRLRVSVRATTSGSEHESKLFISRGNVLLKVEVNHVFRGTVYPLVIGTLTKEAQEKFSRALSVPMLDPDELYASKLVAALDRQHPPDTATGWLCTSTGSGCAVVSASASWHRAVRLIQSVVAKRCFMAVSAGNASTMAQARPVNRR